MHDHRIGNPTGNLRVRSFISPAPLIGGRFVHETRGVVYAWCEFGDTFLEKIAPSCRNRFVRALLAWFRNNVRDLPWRRHRTPYTAWVAEIMLQQTRVEQGVPYFERFLAAFPDVQTLASASEDEVLKRWEGLGYYSRARNLQRAARYIVANCRGVFPETASEWMALPGVGRYTAGAIASMAFGERVPVVDGNVIRVLSRVFDIAECTDDTRTRETLWQIAESLVPKTTPGMFNEAIMELGALVCLPRGPLCTDCPLRAMCRVYAAGRPESRPVRRATSQAPHRDTVAAVILQRKRILIAKRPSKGLLGGLWEFPGGEVLPDESHRDALARWLLSRMGVAISVGQPLVQTEHAYSHFRVTLYTYTCRIRRGSPVDNFYPEHRWVEASALRTYAFPKVQHPSIEAVLDKGER